MDEMNWRTIAILISILLGMFIVNFFKVQRENYLLKSHQCIECDYSKYMKRERDLLQQVGQLRTELNEVNMKRKR
jgi:predicted nucleic-acid-binding Zn-ribbon protein